MPITPPLQRFVDDELSRCVSLCEDSVKLTMAQLKQPREGALSRPEREQYHELLQSLPKRATDFVRTFSTTLREAVAAEIAGTDPLPGPGGSRGLELMDETRVEADIEVAGAAQLIAGSAEWELRELQTFTSTLAGLKFVSANTLPLNPNAYARALWEACRVVSADAGQRSTLLRTAAGVLSGQLKKAWAAASTRLEAQGVEPGIYKTVVLSHGPHSGRAPPMDVTRPGALESLLPRMPVSAGPTPDAAGARGSGRRAIGPAFDQLLARLEAQLRPAALPQSNDLPPLRLAEHRAELAANSSLPLDRQIVELMSRLFDAMLSDQRLPPAYRTVVAQLQVSALRVALSDPMMLESHDHPVWGLLNRLGSAAESYTHTADPRWTALLARCERLVDQTARAPAHDAPLYARGIAQLDEFLGEQLREQQTRAAPIAESLTKLEQRDEVEQQISQRLIEQMDSMRVPPGVRRFVTITWAKALAESIQRHGEHAQETLEFLRATDDLLWSLRLPDHPQSRKRLLAMLPGLLSKLRAGLTLAGVGATEQQAVLDDLMAVHTEALKPGKAAAPERELTPQEIVQRMREESTWEPSGRPPFGDSLIDLSSMETVPADILPATAPAPAGSDPHVEVMNLGSRHAMFVHGRWEHVQLLWRSPRAQFFLFAGGNPLRPRSITRRALERLCEEKLVKPLDDVSLVQRAVDGLMNELTPSN